MPEVRWPGDVDSAREGLHGVREEPAMRINPWMLFTGSFIPNWLLTREEVSSGAKLAYARLAQYAGKEGRAYPKIPDLAAECGTSERSMHRHLAELADQGLIESVQRGMGLPNDFFFNDHPWMGLAEQGTPEMAEQELPKVAEPTIKRIRSRESVATSRDKPADLVTAESTWKTSGLGPVSMRASGKLRGLIAAHGLPMVLEGIEKAAAQGVSSPGAWMETVLPAWQRERNGNGATTVGVSPSAGVRRGGYAEVATSEGHKKWSDPNYRHPSTR